MEPSPSWPSRWPRTSHGLVLSCFGPFWSGRYHMSCTTRICLTGTVVMTAGSAAGSIGSQGCPSLGRKVGRSSCRLVVPPNESTAHFSSVSIDSLPITTAVIRLDE